MRPMWRFTLAMVVAGTIACETDPGAPGVATGPGLAQVGGGTSGRVTGGGHYDLPGLVVQFSLSAVQHANGNASGQFHQRVDEGGGLVVDIHGTVTCLAVDPAQHRAWIGGVVTKNTSTDPDLQTAIHQPGRDVWFRVVDYGSGSATPPDRTTFLGFEGAGGIITSEEYCAARIWPAGDARTWPVTGNITVAP
ncbi:MAG: hypothetical protein ACREMV_14830 [Gemmatimonadales bacterium]